jgi:hypothetical protein
MDNVQKSNICINVPSSQTFRSYSPEGSLLPGKEPVIGPYSEPVECNQHDYGLFLEDLFQFIISSAFEFPKYYLPFRFSTTISFTVLVACVRVTCPIHFIHFDLIIIVTDE